MNKKEFLEELKNNLNGLPNDEIEERISFYDEMIDDRVEEGKTEEEAISDLGGVDGVVNDIAKDTKLFNLVKEKIKPKRKLNGWEIALIIITFELWFPLLFTTVILFFVAYLVLWILDVTLYAIDLSCVIGAIASFGMIFVCMFNGAFRLEYVGMTLACAGLSILFLFAALYFTKLSVFITKKSILGIKTCFIRGGRK